MPIAHEWCCACAVAVVAAADGAVVGPYHAMLCYAMLCSMHKSIYLKCARESYEFDGLTGEYRALTNQQVICGHLQQQQQQTAVNMKENETTPNIWCVPLKPHNFIHYARNSTKNGYYFPQIVHWTVRVGVCGSVCVYKKIATFLLSHFRWFQPNL